MLTFVANILKIVPFKDEITFLRVFIKKRNCLEKRLKDRPLGLEKRDTFY